VNDDRRFSQDAHTYLDGEQAGPVSNADRSDADRLLDAVESYAARLSAPGPSLTAAVMERVARRGTGRQPVWRWVFEPQPIRLRPIWAPIMAALLLVVWLAVGSRGPDIAQPPVAAGVDTVFVQFRLVAPEASAVSLAGSFSNWRSDLFTMTREDGGVWSLTLPLAIGEHHYQFVVDGQRWIPDPTAHAQIDDGFGGTNSVIVVGPRGVVRS
jgi:hypothetical protein